MSTLCISTVHNWKRSSSVRGNSTVPALPNVWFRSGDFVYMLLVSMFMLLGLSFLTGHFSNFYSGAIIDVMT